MYNKHKVEYSLAYQKKPMKLTTKILCLFLTISFSSLGYAQTKKGTQTTKSNKAQSKTTTQKKDTGIKLTEGSYSNYENGVEGCLMTINIRKEMDVYKYTIDFNNTKEEGILKTEKKGTDLYLGFKNFQALYDNTDKLHKIMIQNYNNVDDKVILIGCDEKFIELSYEL